MFTIDQRTYNCGQLDSLLYKNIILPQVIPEIPDQPGVLKKIRHALRNWAERVSTCLLKVITHVKSLYGIQGSAPVRTVCLRRESRYISTSPLKPVRTSLILHLIPRQVSIKSYINVLQFTLGPKIEMWRFRSILLGFCYLIPLWIEVAFLHHLSKHENALRPLSKRWYCTICDNNV